VVIQRGDVYWVDLGEPQGSRPALRRPVLIVSDDLYNSSNIATVIAVVLTGNLALADMPGNVYVPDGDAGLPRPSVVNVTSLLTLGKDELGKKAGRVRAPTLRQVDDGLKEVLGLWIRIGINT
jgi:mRNA interferase MazF